jgi:hypothetical protein
MSAFVFMLVSVGACAVAIIAAGFADRSLKRMLDIEDAIYERLDREFESHPERGTP